MDCIKEKQIKHTKKGAIRSTRLLEKILHIDLCDPFDVSSFSKEIFLSLLLTIFHVMDMYLLHEKSQAINTLEALINEVKRKLGKKVKIIKSDRGCEYYGRYDEAEQHPDPFGKFLKKHDKCARYTCMAHHNKVV